jgi:phage shock protein E
MNMIWKVMESIKIYYKVCPDIDFQKFIEQGGIIVDVRSQQEFLAGHIEDSLNIPLEELMNTLHRLPNHHQPIITCCTSGMKSASAKVMLESVGYTSVCNGGSWKNLLEKIFYGTASV